MSGDLRGWLYAICAVVAILACLLIYGTRETSCAAKGGHLRSIGRSSVCVSPDGRLL